MRITARPQLHYAPVADGAYLAGATSQLLLRGSPDLFRLLDVCLPLLEDGACEDELVGALGSPGTRPAVRHLLDTMRAHGMLLDPTSFTVPEPPAKVRARYPDTVAFLEAVSDDPYAALARLTAATVLLVGSPEVVRPAARGLRRAGAGHVVEAAATDAAGSTAALAAPLGPGDAVVVCGPGPERSRGRRPGRRCGMAGLPEGVPVVPVVLDADLAVAGPVLRREAEEPNWAELVRRARSWTGRPLDAPSPVVGALVGALAAQLVVGLLTGTEAEGAAQVVHGPLLASDRVVVTTRPDDDPPTEHRLGAARLAPPVPGEAYEAVAALSPRWTGPVELVLDDDLPQLPLALRQVRWHAGPVSPPGRRGGSVVGWAADQQSASVAAVLSALRRRAGQVSGDDLDREPDGQQGPAVVRAAGLTEQLWLLDGALRLLTTSARPIPGGCSAARRLGSSAPEDPDTARIRRALQPHVGDDVPLRLLAVAGIDWVLARVATSRGDGIPVLAWGPDPAGAVRAALATALAREQAASVIGDRDAVAPVCTDALLRCPGPALATLREQVVRHLAGSGRHLAGSRYEHDCVLGSLPLWAGTVRWSAPDAGAAR